MAQNTDGQSAQTSSAPKKRSLFNKPKRSAPTEEEANVDLFSRSKELFPLRVAEAERKRQAKSQRPARKRSSSVSEGEAPNIRDGKKTRLSSEEAEEVEPAKEVELNDNTRVYRDSTGSIHQEHISRPTSNRNSRQNTPGFPSSPPYEQIPVHEKHAFNAKEQMSKNIIALSDSEDDGEIQMLKKPAKGIEPEDEFGLEDEEFPELVLKARERERQMELDRAKPKNDEEYPKGQIIIDDLDDDFLGKSSPAPDADPIVEILVSSPIEGTRPLIVRRKLSQRLKEVRLSWCDRQFVDGQPLGPTLKASTFLTWKGKKLFDVTTCKGLGITVNSSGVLDSDGEGFDAQGRIHLEAWTEESYKSYQQELANHEQNLGDSKNDEPREEKPQERKIRIIMTPREMEPYKLMVKPTTTIGRMILAFAKMRSVPSDKEISIFFDGDKLDPDSTVEDTDLDDMDTVEVHIK
ncbi:ubiquitin-2 like Rad60 SUMO-like-domain-containing protein [Xylogone sp. PMI_703]|nr:ubiquitin-2 like Rad60 SUMO-like-domain-containing protein [Xylogone sp. PMI_703]